MIKTKYFLSILFLVINISFASSIEDLISCKITDPLLAIPLPYHIAEIEQCNSGHRMIVSAVPGKCWVFSKYVNNDKGEEFYIVSGVIVAYRDIDIKDNSKPDEFEMGLGSIILSKKDDHGNMKNIAIGEVSSAFELHSLPENIERALAQNWIYRMEKIFGGADYLRAAIINEWGENPNAPGFLGEILCADLHIGCRKQ